MYIYYIVMLQTKYVNYSSPLDMKGCICHFVKWQIHPLQSKGMYYVDRLLLCTHPEQLVCVDYYKILVIINVIMQLECGIHILESV